MLRTSSILAVLLLAMSGFAPGAAAERRMALTFDDLPAQRAEALPPERVVEMNRRLVAALERQGIPAVGFVNEVKLEARPEAAGEIGQGSSWCQDVTRAGDLAEGG